MPLYGVAQTIGHVSMPSETAVGLLKTRQTTCYHVGDDGDSSSQVSSTVHEDEARQYPSVFRWMPRSMALVCSFAVPHIELMPLYVLPWTGSLIPDAAAGGLNMNVREVMVIS